MKKIFFYIIGLVLMASCQHDVIYEADYNVTLDKENTYYVGDPVKFNVTGDVDNIVFYSGETGHQYIYRDRFEVPIEAVSNAVLHLDGWIISAPAPLNKVSNDKGIVIKNLQNYLHTYEYTWTKPGTYEVAFVGRNENYASSSEEVKKFTVTILEKPVEL